jgi:hypothetical protein
MGEVGAKLREEREAVVRAPQRERGEAMLALGRALMLAPRIILIDEPSVGLAPVLVSRTIDKIKELKDRYQLTVLMAEQNFTQAIRIADRGYVIVHGRIEFAGTAAVANAGNRARSGEFVAGLGIQAECFGCGVKLFARFGAFAEVFCLGASKLQCFFLLDGLDHLLAHFFQLANVVFLHASVSFFHSSVFKKVITIAYSF